MSVDANVLIFERIKEELRNGNTPQSSIFIGFEKAFATILDSNITTLLVAVMLFAFGTGSVKGFAVTLIIGLLSSMFTAITGTRMIMNWVYGNRRVEKLSI
jgi:preprotein translocase subunit SecD